MRKPGLREDRTPAPGHAVLRGTEGGASPSRTFSPGVLRHFSLPLYMPCPTRLKLGDSLPQNGHRTFLAGAWRFSITEERGRDCPLRLVLLYAERTGILQPQLQTVGRWFTRTRVHTHAQHLQHSRSLPARWSAGSCGSGRGRDLGLPGSCGRRISGSSEPAAAEGFRAAPGRAGRAPD